jgi:hypothetical protein
VFATNHTTGISPDGDDYSSACPRTKRSRLSSAAINSRLLLARIRFSPLALIGFAAPIHMPLRIFGVPISLDLYALHDARRITSRLTRSIGLKLECPHTPIYALPFNFLSVIFETTRLPSRFTTDKAILFLRVSTAETLAYRSRLASNYPPPLSKQWFS